MKLNRRILWGGLAPLLVAMLAAFACDQKAKPGDGDSGEEAKIVPSPDKPMEAYRVKLLDTAFETVSLIPAKPLIKDRCKAQEEIVLACLELGQSARAFSYTERIEDWRRLYCYAEMAMICAKNGDPRGAHAYLKRTGEPPFDKAEDWQRDRIKAKAAQAFALLGDDEQAGLSGSGLVDAEAGKLRQTQASLADDASFDAQMKSVETLSDPKNVDLLRNAAGVYAQLFNRFYDAPEKRDLAQEKFRAICEKLPALWREQLVAELAGYALDHRDNAKALELVNEAQSILDAHEWPDETRLALAARIIELRFRAGDAEKARADAAAALGSFKQNREKIVDIWRAGALRPLAKAYAAMGDKTSALAVFKIAIEEGAINPNSRPRAEDLAATCTAMALCGLEPDAEISARIEAIRSKLGDPW